MSYRVDLASRKVERQIRNLPPEAKAKIIEAIKSLAQDPRPHGVEKISGVRGVRLAIKSGAPSVALDSDVMIGIAMLG